MAGALCFDLGGTLVDRARDRDLCAHWALHGVRLPQAAASAAIYRADRMFMEAHADLWRRADAEFAHHYWAEVHAGLGLPCPAITICAAWGGPYRLYPDACRALRELGRSGQRLALISNWDATGLDVLRTTGLTPYFEVVAFSQAVGACKPGRELFRWTAERLGLAPEECIHIGDNYWDDVVGATEAGMRALLLHRHPEWSAMPAVSAGVPVATNLDAALPYLLGPQTCASAGSRASRHGVPAAGATAGRGPAATTTGGPLRSGTAVHS